MEVLFGDVLPALMFAQGVEKFIDIHPAFFVQLDSERIRVVPQCDGHCFAEPHVAIVVTHFLSFDAQ